MRLALHYSLVCGPVPNITTHHNYTDTTPQHNSHLYNQTPLHHDHQQTLFDNTFEKQAMREQPLPSQKCLAVQAIA